MKSRITNAKAPPKAARAPEGTENIWHEFWKLRASGTAPAVRARASLAQMGGASFIAESGSGHHVLIDDGGAAGPTPVELLAAALAACVGSDVIATVRANHQAISAYEVRVEAEQAERPPRVLVAVRIHHVFHGHDIDPAVINAALGGSEERSGALQAMLRHTASIETTFEIISESRAKADSSGDQHEDDRGGHQNFPQEHSVHD